MAKDQSNKTAGAQREPAPPPRRRVTLRIEVEADDMQTARGVVARLAARVSTGQEAYEEERAQNSALLSVAYDHSAPTGAAFGKALEEWKREHLGQEPPRGTGHGPIAVKRGK